MSLSICNAAPELADGARPQRWSRSHRITLAAAMAQSGTDGLAWHAPLGSAHLIEASPLASCAINCPTLPSASATQHARCADTASRCIEGCSSSAQPRAVASRCGPLSLHNVVMLPVPPDVALLHQMQPEPTFKHPLGVLHRKRVRDTDDENSSALQWMQVTQTMPYVPGMAAVWAFLQANYVPVDVQPGGRGIEIAIVIRDMWANVNFATLRGETSAPLLRYTLHLISNCLKLQYPLHDRLFETHFLSTDGTRFLIDRLPSGLWSTRAAYSRAPTRREQQWVLRETARLCAAPPDYPLAPQRPVGSLADPADEVYGPWTRLPLLEDRMRAEDWRIGAMEDRADFGFAVQPRGGGDTPVRYTNLLNCMPRDVAEFRTAAEDLLLAQMADSRDVGIVGDKLFEHLALTEDWAASLDAETRMLEAQLAVLDRFVSHGPPEAGFDAQTCLRRTMLPMFNDVSGSAPPPRVQPGSGWLAEHHQWQQHADNRRRKTDDSSALAGQPSRQSLRGRGTITSEGMLVSVAPASHPPVMAPRIVYVSQSARAHGEQHMLHARTDQHVAHARTDKHVVHARIDQPVVRTDQHVLHAPTPPTWSSDSTVVVNVALTSPPSSPSPTKQSARLQKRHADGRQQKRR